MQDVKFIEDDSIKDNCKMLYVFTFTNPNYNPDDERKKEVAKEFMDILGTDMYANEVEFVHPEFDIENNKVIKLSITLFNGNISKSLIREAINKKNISPLLEK
jgi:hypothetical protein